MSRGLTYMRMTREEWDAYPGRKWTDGDRCFILSAPFDRNVPVEQVQWDLVLIMFITEGDRAAEKPWLAHCDPCGVELQMYHGHLHLDACYQCHQPWTRVEDLRDRYGIPKHPPGPRLVE